MLLGELKWRQGWMLAYFFSPLLQSSTLLPYALEFPSSSEALILHKDKISSWHTSGHKMLSSQTLVYFLRSYSKRILKCYSIKSVLFYDLNIISNWHCNLTEKKLNFWKLISFSVKIIWFLNKIKTTIAICRKKSNFRKLTSFYDECWNWTGYVRWYFTVKFKMSTICPFFSEYDLRKVADH